MPSFNTFSNATNTASTTVPMFSLMATATSQIAIYEINTGSDATADNAVKYSIRRNSASSLRSKDRGFSAKTWMPRRRHSRITGPSRWKGGFTTAMSGFSRSNTCIQASMARQGRPQAARACRTGAMSSAWSSPGPATGAAVHSRSACAPDGASTARRQWPELPRRAAFSYLPFASTSTRNPFTLET